MIDIRDEQDRPKATLAEFAELVGGAQLQPYQRELLEMIERLGPKARVLLELPRTARGQIKGANIRLMNTR